MDAREIVKQELTARAMNQRDLDRRSGVKYYTINKWLTGRTRSLLWVDAVAIAQALRLPLEYLATGDKKWRTLRQPSMERFISVGSLLTKEQRYEAIGMLRFQFNVNSVTTSDNREDAEE